MKRTFIAVKILTNEKVCAFVDKMIFLLKNEKIKWIEMENFHITLFFLGETENEKIFQIEKELVQIAKNNKKSALSIQGAGTFNKGHIPSVIWLGTKIEKELIKLQKEIAQMLFNYGYKSDREDFVPHLTIGRIKNIKNTNTLKSLVDKNKNEYFSSSIIESFLFYESILTPKGSQYKIIKEFMLQ